MDRASDQHLGPQILVFVGSAAFVVLLFGTPLLGPVRYIAGPALIAGFSLLFYNSRRGRLWPTLVRPPVLKVGVLSSILFAVFVQILCFDAYIAGYLLYLNDAPKIAQTYASGEVGFLGMLAIVGLARLAFLRRSETTADAVWRSYRSFATAAAIAPILAVVALIAVSTISTSCSRSDGGCDYELFLWLFTAFMWVETIAFTIVSWIAAGWAGRRMWMEQR